MDKPNQIHDGWDEYRNRRIYRPHKKITFGRSVGYGVFSAYDQAMQGLVGGWLLFFYTNFCELSAFAGASIFAVGRVVDAFTTLLAGNISDKFYRHKIGRALRRRHFFLLLAAPATLIAILQWVPNMNYIYYLFSYLLTNVLTSFLEIPYDTLSNEMTNDYNGRTKLSTSRLVFAGAFAPVLQWLIAQMFKIWPKDNPLPYISAQAIFSVVAFVLVLVTYFTTWEHFVSKKEAATIELHTEDKQQSFKSTFKQDVKNYLSTFKIKVFRIHLVIFGCSYLAAAVWGTVFAYYIVGVLGLQQSTAAYLNMFSLVSIPVTLLAGWMITKVQPKTVYYTAYVPILVVCVAMAVIAMIKPAHLIVWLSVIVFVYEVGQYILWFVPWNVFPLIPDIDTIVTGKNRSGVFASVMTFIQQTSIGLGTILVGLLLDASGFIQSKSGAVTQPASAKMMVVAIISLGIGLLILVALFGAMKFKVNRETSKIVDDELKRLQNGGSLSDATPLAKKQLPNYPELIMTRLRSGRNNILIMINNSLLNV